MKDEWVYCPKCGSRKKADIFRSLFSEITKQMKDMDREMQRMEKSFEVRDISELFRKPRSSGVSIKIVRATGREPKISVKTFGNVNQDIIKKQIQHQISHGKPIKLTLNQGNRDVNHEYGMEKKITEEPKTNIKSEQNKVSIDLEIPGVRSLNEIEITELENSVEVKAMTEDKAYFKILTKPPQTKLIKKEFSKGKLHMIFS